jgi:hypothetical protein
MRLPVLLCSSIALSGALFIRHTPGDLDELGGNLSVRVLHIIPAPLPPVFPFQDCIGTAEEINACAAELANPTPDGEDTLRLEFTLERIERPVNFTPSPRRFDSVVYRESVFDFSYNAGSKWLVDAAKCTRTIASASDVHVPGHPPPSDCVYAAERWLWELSRVSIRTRNYVACDGVDAGTPLPEPGEACVRDVYLTFDKWLEPED